MNAKNIICLECTTKPTFDETTNAVPEEPCIFPFIYYGLEHVKCVYDKSHNIFWCPTETNEKGEYEPSSGKWGECNEGCEKEGE